MARRICAVTGLAIAILVATILYPRLDRSAATPSGHGSPGRPARTLRRMVTLSPDVPDGTVQLTPAGAALVDSPSAGRGEVWPTGAWRPRTLGGSGDGVSPGDNRLAPPAFSPDGSVFAALYFSDSLHSVAVLWNTATGQRRVIPLPAVPAGNSLISVAPGPGSVLASIYSDGSAALENENTGRVIGTASISRAPQISYTPAAPLFSRDGTRIIAAGDSGSCYLWSTGTSGPGAVLSVEGMYNGTADPIDSVAVSPDSKSVACGSDSGVIRVWDLRTRRILSTFTVNGHSQSGAAANPVRVLVFSPDGRSLITATGASNAVSVWNVASGRKLATFSAGTGDVVSAAFTSAGALMVATTTGSGSAQQIGIWTTRKSLASLLPRS